jgi:uncharacterized membrane protein
MQLEQTLEDEEDVMTMGISFRHDEHTPPVMLLLFILLVSFILPLIRSLASASRVRERERPDEQIGHEYFERTIESC